MKSKLAYNESDHAGMDVVQLCKDVNGMEDGICPRDKDLGETFLAVEPSNCDVNRGAAL